MKLCKKCQEDCSKAKGPSVNYPESCDESDCQFWAHVKLRDYGTVIRDEFGYNVGDEYVVARAKMLRGEIT